MAALQTHLPCKHALHRLCISELPSKQPATLQARAHSSPMPSPSQQTSATPPAKLASPAKAQSAELSHAVVIAQPIRVATDDESRMLTVPHAAVPPAQWQNVVRLARTNWNMFVQIARVFRDCGSPAIASLCASANFVPGLYLVTVSLQLLDRIMDNNQAADVSPVTQTPLGNTYTENERQNAKKPNSFDRHLSCIAGTLVTHTD